jgi:hypothetical protein
VRLAPGTSLPLSLGSLEANASQVVRIAIHVASSLEEFGMDAKVVARDLADRSFPLDFPERVSLDPDRK